VVRHYLGGAALRIQEQLLRGIDPRGGNHSVVAVASIGIELGIRMRESGYGIDRWLVESVDCLLGTMNKYQ